jgi:hypothetical protein
MAANYVAYCFAPVSGYSSFGSYTGNGSTTDGPFVYTGFRPRCDNAEAQQMQPETGSSGIPHRNTYNVANTYYYA